MTQKDRVKKKKKKVCVGGVLVETLELFLKIFGGCVFCPGQDVEREVFF